MSMGDTNIFLIVFMVTIAITGLMFLVYMLAWERGLRENAVEYDELLKKYYLLKGQYEYDDVKKGDKNIDSKTKRGRKESVT